MRKPRVIAAVAWLMATVAGAFPAHAQRVERIAAIVNDDIVSVFDLQSRLQMVISSAGLRPTPQLQKRLAGQVLRRLIDERLQLQEAKRRNVTVTKRNMKQAVAQIEKQNHLPPGSFDSFMKRNGIPKDTALDQIRAQISWAKLVGRVLTPRVTVGEDEIQEQIDRIKSRRGQMEYRLSEILLTVDRPDQEQEVRRTAERLIDELRGGARFEAVARQFSRGASASVGGDLGWLTEASIDPDLRQVISRMQPSEIVGPVRTLAGIHILRLAEKRRIMAPSEDETIVDLRQIVLPVPRKASDNAVQAQTDLARALSNNISGCDDMARAAKEAKSTASTVLGKVKLADLSKPVRAAVENLALGKPSPPVRSEGGIAVYMVCGRTAPKGNMPSREQIAKRIRMQRLEILARRYMRDLRSAAIVDLRI